MKIDEKIINEIKRYKQINRYINEQDTGLPAPPEAEVAPPAAAPAPEAAPLLPPTASENMDAGAPPPPDAGAELPPPVPVDIENDPDVKKVDDEKDEKQVEVTDLVDAQKVLEKKQDEMSEMIMAQLDDLERKLSVMDELLNKIDNLENKIEKYRVKTPEEKLELRSLDSGPYKQKLSDFFAEKEPEMEMSGKNEYIITQDEIEDFSPSDIKKSFKNFGDDMKLTGGFQKI